MLSDKFFLWPYEGISLKEAVGDITPLLLKSALSEYMGKNRTGHLAEFIALECRFWNVSPWWILVSAQREQSTLGRRQFDDKAAEAWLGVVGQDVGRTVNPGFYGVYTQVARCCEVTAWLLGVEDSKKWPAYLRTRKEAKRYHTGISIPVEKDGEFKPRICVSAGEYMQLAFTPHDHVLKTNETIARTYVPLKFL